MNSFIFRPYALVILLSLGGFLATAQQEAYIRFKTDNGKTMSLSLDTTTNTLTYSYGFAGKPELILSDNLNDTISVFTYAWYMRGGGSANDGLNLTQFRFENDGYSYAIYYDYTAVDNQCTCGITVTHLASGKVTNIKGNPRTLSCNLSRFRFENLIPVVEL